MNIIPSEQRTAILTSLAEGRTITALAEEYGVARSTIYRWRNTAENLEILKTNIITNYLTTINDTSNKLSDIVKVLWDIALDETVKPSNRIKATDSLLRIVQMGMSQLVAAEVVAVKEQILALGQANND